MTLAPIRGGSPTICNPPARKRGFGFCAPYGSSRSISFIRPVVSALVHVAFKVAQKQGLAVALGYTPQLLMQRLPHLPPAQVVCLRGQSRWHTRFVLLPRGGLPPGTLRAVRWATP